MTTKHKHIGRAELDLLDREYYEAYSCKEPDMLSEESIIIEKYTALDEFQCSYCKESVGFYSTANDTAEDFHWTDLYVVNHDEAEVMCEACHEEFYGEPEFLCGCNGNPECIRCSTEEPF